MRNQVSGVTPYPKRLRNFVARWRTCSRVAFSCITFRPTRSVRLSSGIIFLTSLYAKKRKTPFVWLWRTRNNANDQQENAYENVCLFSAPNSHNAANSLSRKGKSMMRNGTNTSFGQLQQIDAGVLNVGYAEAGKSDGPAVMLLHGWPYDIHSYVDVAPRLAQAGYRVIVPYLRGYGTTRFLSSDTFRNGRRSHRALGCAQDRAGDPGRL